MHSPSVMSTTSILSAPQNELGAAFRPVKRSLTVVLAQHQRMRTPIAPGLPLCIYKS